MFCYKHAKARHVYTIDSRAGAKKGIAQKLHSIANISLAKTILSRARQIRVVDKNEQSRRVHVTVGWKNRFGAVATDCPLFALEARSTRPSVGLDYSIGQILSHAG